MTEQHDPHAGHDHGPIPPEMAQRLEEIKSAITALDPERRNLLISATQHKVADMLDAAVHEFSRQDLTPAERMEAVSTLVLARQVVTLGGMTTEQIRTENEDWTRDRDRRVEEVWDLFVDTVRNSAAVALTKEDLDPALVERLQNGTQTPEDMDALRRLAAKKAGVDPDEVEDMEIVRVGPDGQQVDAPAAKEKAAGTADYSGDGLYL